MKIQIRNMIISQRKHCVHMRDKLKDVIIENSVKTNADPNYEYTIEDVIGQWSIFKYMYKKAIEYDDNTCFCGSVCIHYFGNTFLSDEAKLFHKFYNKILRYGQSPMLSGKYEGMLIKDVLETDLAYAKFIYYTRMNEKVDFDFGNYGKLSQYYHLKTNNVIYKSDETEFEINYE